MTKLPKRFSYYLYRESQWEEIPLVRTPDLRKLELPRPIVLVNGAFDLLHRSHMRLLFAARHKAEGGTLICALDSDQKVQKEKGEERPILTFLERLSTLAYFPVDFVVEIGTTADMNRLVATVQPDLRVQGYEYRGLPSRYKTKKALVREGSIHTTGLIERVLERYAK